MGGSLRILVVLCFLLAAISPLHAAESCTTIRGRAHYFAGDANLRIWHVGTHHDFTPDRASWDRVLHWLQEGVRPVDKHSAAPESEVYLFADFRICPTEPFKKGSLQEAKVLSATHRRYVPAEIIFKQKQARSTNP